MSTLLEKLAEIFTDKEVAAMQVERIRELYNYNPNTGEFKHALKRRGVSNLDKPVGTPDNGYLRIRVDNKLRRANRMAWEYEKGPVSDNLVIDHIDHDRLNNRFDNLRAVTRAENSKNLSKAKNNSTGTTGVFLDRGKHRAKITSDGKTTYLGSFDSDLDAIAARVRALEEKGFFKNHGL